MRSHPSLALFLIGGALIGAGAGAVYQGTTGLVLQATPPENRVAMTSALVIAVFVGLSVPVLGAGVALNEGASAPHTVLDSPFSSRWACASRVGRCWGAARQAQPRRRPSTARRWPSGSATMPHWAGCDRLNVPPCRLARWPGSYCRGESGTRCPRGGGQWQADATGSGSEQALRGEPSKASSGSTAADSRAATLSRPGGSSTGLKPRNLDTSS